MKKLSQKRKMEAARKLKRFLRTTSKRKLIARLKQNGGLKRYEAAKDKLKKSIESAKSAVTQASA